MLIFIIDHYFHLRCFISKCNQITFSRRKKLKFNFPFWPTQKYTFSSYSSEIKYTIFKFPGLQSVFLFINCSGTGYDQLIYRSTSSIKLHKEISAKNVSTNCSLRIFILHCYRTITSTNGVVFASLLIIGSFFQKGNTKYQVMAFFRCELDKK